MPKRLCLYAHYDKDQIIDNHVVFQLKQYRELFDTTIFVSTSCKPEELERVTAFTDQQIIRANDGYDFLSWRTALECVEDLVSYDEVLFTNDSIYGPIYPLQDLFAEMSNNKYIDFWGITENFEVHRHVQSYFLVLKQNVIKSQTFEDWLKTIGPRKTKKDYVIDFEVTLTKNLTKAGFKYETTSAETNGIHQTLRKRVFQITSLLRPYLPLSQININSKLYKSLRQKISPNPSMQVGAINKEQPFLKVLLMKNIKPQQSNLIIQKIASQSNYPTHYIREHLQRTNNG